MPSDADELTRRMDATSSGDDAAFDALARTTQDRLFRFALAHGLRPADAAEATQETFLRAWRQRRAWRRGGRAMAWLYGIAMNVVREARRTRARHRGADVEIDALGDLARREADGPQQAEQLGRLAAALERLPPRQREAVACRYLRQLSVRQTAAAMGCAEGTVKAAVFAGLRNLRTALHEEP